jgi:phosphate starvation-inducible PhoH-like protein
LGEVTGISFTNFDRKDVVRHPLVQRVVDAYESQEQTESSSNVKPLL